MALTKPEPVTKTALRYHEAYEYVKAKYGLRDEFTMDGRYCSFWHWLVDLTGLHNGSYVWIPFDRLMPEIREQYGSEPEWVLKFLEAFQAEFAPGQDSLEVWVSW